MDRQKTDRQSSAHQTVVVPNLSQKGPEIVQTETPIEQTTPDEIQLPTEGEIKKGEPNACVDPKLPPYSTDQNYSQGKQQI